jgi:hypothetical protein
MTLEEGKETCLVEAISAFSARGSEKHSEKAV